MREGKGMKEKSVAGWAVDAKAQLTILGRGSAAAVIEAHYELTASTVLAVARGGQKCSVSISVLPWSGGTMLCCRARLPRRASD